MRPLWVAVQYRPPALGWWCISWDNVLTTSCLCTRLINNTSVNYRVWPTWVPMTSNRYCKKKRGLTTSQRYCKKKSIDDLKQVLSKWYCIKSTVEVKQVPNDNLKQVLSKYYWRSETGTVKLYWLIFWLCWTGTVKMIMYIWKIAHYLFL